MLSEPGIARRGYIGAFSFSHFIYLQLISPDTGSSLDVSHGRLYVRRPMPVPVSMARKAVCFLCLCAPCSFFRLDCLLKVKLSVFTAMTDVQGYRGSTPSLHALLYHLLRTRCGVLGYDDKDHKPIITGASAEPMDAGVCSEGMEPLSSYIAHNTLLWVCEKSVNFPLCNYYTCS